MRTPALTVSMLAFVWAEAAAAQAAPDGAAGLRPIGGSSIAAASVETRITADEAAERSLGTTVTRGGNIYVVDGGRLAGTNLFHSFANFDLAQGDVARWTHGGGDPSSISNVINRVTGGDPSHIFGTLDSTAIPNADFYFINPAGILFGAGAQVNVPAAAHFSTASELRFASGPAFQVTEPNGTLSLASPEAFGFRGDEGAILLAGLEQDFLPAANALGLSGSAVRVENSSFSPGSLALSAVGSAETSVSVAAPDTFAREGDLVLLDTVITTRSGPEATGAVSIAGGTLLIEGSLIGTAAGPDDGDRVFAGGDIDLRAGTRIELTNSRLSTETDHGGGGGEIRLRAPKVVISGATGGSSPPVSVQTSTHGGGSGGTVRVQADELAIRSAAFQTSTGSCDGDACGDGGSVFLDVGDMRMEDASLFTQSTGEAAGEIHVTASGSIEIVDSTLSSDRVTEDDGGYGCYGVGCYYAIAAARRGGTSIAGGFSASTRGDPGSITLAGHDIAISGGSVIGTNSDRASGDVTIEAQGDLSIDDSSVRADADGGGTTGLVRITGTNLAFNNAHIGTSASSGSDIYSSGGFSRGVQISGANIRLNDSGVGSYAGGEGAFAGNISVVASDSLDLVDSGLTSFASCPSGCSSGNITASGHEITILDSEIVTRPFSGAAISGNVTIDASAGLSMADTFIETLTGSIFLDAVMDLSVVDSVFRLGSDSPRALTAGSFILKGRNVFVDSTTIVSFIEAFFIPGCDSYFCQEPIVPRFGSFSASEAVTIRNSNVRLANGESGNGGSLFVEGSEIHLSGSQFSTEAQGGYGGVFTATATGKVSIEDTDISTAASGFGGSGNISIAAPEVLVSESTISSDAEFGAPAGTIDFQGSTVTIKDGSVISSSAHEYSSAGEISISASSVSLSDSRISSDAEKHSSAGSIAIAASAVTIGPGSVISSSALDTSRAGTIDIAGDRVEIREATVATDNVDGDQSQGNIAIRASEEAVLRGALVSAETRGAGPGGDILIAAPRLTLEGGSDRGLPVDENSLPPGFGSITASTAGAGDAGSITLEADEMSIDKTNIASESILCAIGDCPTGAPGKILVTAGTLRIQDSQLETQNNSVHSQTLGEIRVVVAETFELSRSQILADTFGANDAGSIFVTAGGALTASESEITSRSFDSGNAGRIAIDAAAIALDDMRIVSEASSGTGDAGAIDLRSAGNMLIRRSQISTDSAQGAAGDIALSLPGNSLLFLDGSAGDPTVITTSSGPGAGGRITIGSPLAIIATGSEILALGQSGGANVQINGGFFIASADEPNRVEVEGDLRFENPVTDVSAGTVDANLAVLDTSSVLRGQCASIRATGQLSQLSVRPVGPYRAGRRLPTAQGKPKADSSGGAGGCQ